MDTSSPVIREFDPAVATPAAWQALNRFRNRVLAERLPDDPPEPLEATIRLNSNPPAFLGRQVWTAWNTDEIVGQAEVCRQAVTGHEHLAEFGVEVRPEWRRRGLGRRLLALAAETAQAGHRRLLMTETWSSVAAGAAAMGRLGGVVGQDVLIQQLALAEVDPALLQHWQARAAERTAGFGLEFWAGPYPEQDLEGMASLVSAGANLSPHDALDVYEEQYTVANLREMEDARTQAGVEVWTMVAREQRTGVLAGYTEVYWRPFRPAILWQGGTVVLRAHQNRGLGRWLKAAMVARVLADRPVAQFIRTGNATSNAPMRKINAALGFRPYLGWSFWQVPTDQVLAYLQQVGVPAASLAPV